MRINPERIKLSIFRCLMAHVGVTPKKIITIIMHIHPVERTHKL